MHRQVCSFCIDSPKQVHKYYVLFQERLWDTKKEGNRGFSYSVCNKSCIWISPLQSLPRFYISGITQETIPDLHRSPLQIHEEKSYGRGRKLFTLWDNSSNLGRVPRSKVLQRQTAVLLQSDLLKPTGFCRDSIICNTWQIVRFRTKPELILPQG